MYKIKKLYKEEILSLRKDFPKIPLLTLNYLISKGYNTKEKIERFYNYSLKDIPDFYDYKDGKKAIDQIKKYIKEDKKFLIYGDYDADGIDATAIMVNTLKELNVDVKHYINNRFENGFGLCKDGIDEALSKFDFDVVITVDNGIDRIEEAEYLKELGKRLIITDHHLPLETGEIPDCDAVVNAHRLDETAPFKDMCGAGLAFLLVARLWMDLKNINDDSKSELFSTELFKRNLANAGLATVCDMMPLREYNRWLVSESIKIMNSNDCPYCWKALKKVADCKNSITEETFGFAFGPIINAVGRVLGNVDVAVDLLTENNEAKVYKIANDLSEVNAKRKEMVECEVDLAQTSLLMNRAENLPLNFVYGEYSEGIAGIIASNLKEKNGKPSIVLCETNDETYKGSARSIEGVHIKEVLDQCKDLLVTYGGHAGAAGLTVKKENIELLEKRLSEVLSKLPTNTEDKSREVDFLLRAPDIDVNFIKSIESLGPFGVEFEKPTFCLRGCITNTSKMKDVHIKMTIDHKVFAIWWKKASEFEKIIEDDHDAHKNSLGYEGVELIGYPEANFFGNNTYIQFIVRKLNLWNPDNEFTLSEENKKITYIKKRKEN